MISCKPASANRLMAEYREIKRAKYKHWHIIGFHFESDKAFEQALAAGTVVWLPKIIEPPTLFQK